MKNLLLQITVFWTLFMKKTINSVKYIFCINKTKCKHTNYSVWSLVFISVESSIITQLWCQVFTCWIFCLLQSSFVQIYLFINFAFCCGMLETTVMMWTLCTNTHRTQNTHSFLPSLCSQFLFSAGHSVTPCLRVNETQPTACRFQQLLHKVLCPVALLYNHTWFWALRACWHEKRWSYSFIQELNTHLDVHDVHVGPCLCVLFLWKNE